MKHIKIYKLTLLLVLLGTFVSCNDFLEVEDLDELDITTVFKTEEDLKLALNNLYLTLPILDLEDDLNTQEAAQAYVVPYFWTDDAIHRNISGASTNASEFNWQATTRALRTFYRYHDIADINFFLEALPDAEFETESNKERFAAEARFFRAWIYESMAFAYGDVPLLTNTILPSEQPSQAPRQDVFDFVISELDEIGDMLPESYEGEDIGRITKGAVLALKARAYLNAIGWASDESAMYAGAEAACESIINSGVYAMVDGIAGFEEQFTSASDLVSPETVLATMYVPEFRTHRYARQIALRGTWRGTSGTLTNQRRPGYTSDFIEEVQTINGVFPKDDLSYDPADPWTDRDPRLAASVVLPGDILPATSGINDTYEFQPHPNIAPSADDVGGTNNPTGYGFKKYLDYSLAVLNNGDVDLKLIRYSEILLMYAEALAGRGDNSGALTYLNMVRNRVGMPSYTAANLPNVTRGTTGNDMIDAILLERRYEFAGEGPQRWFDIWRYKLGDQVITSVYGIPQSETQPGDLVGSKFSGGTSTLFERVWNDDYYLLPIWQTFRDANPNLDQNGGY
ncbi:RagB/SusD family nutrient uptake outer membrane protein [Flavivirga jejuensis]|uniref:RagB/SusD family nutrient uptake outer membrane protein n=1 Tax=Flavivirga jejuensis TaxID=870487 RepID=A0ABT8WN24_9FLAO|nr:RagB/SusD family nutrient uptake outer membrane protein [Flavivirga jejuensis]MDO5974563.1 RagB/SusD family nutrient uptake outer membrane protein [Flavivirga jejuensis]